MLTDGPSSWRLRGELDGESRPDGDARRSCPLWWLRDRGGGGRRASAAAGHEVIVYCRNPGQRLVRYRGMRLVNLPSIRTKAFETLSHTALSTVHSIIRGREVVVLFNPANGPLCRSFVRSVSEPSCTSTGWILERAKWGALGRAYFRAAMRLSVRLADDVVADSRAIGDHTRTVYHRDATYIAYGAPIRSPTPDRLRGVGLESRRYHLVVSRFEPENNIAMIVDGYVHSGSSTTLVVVGSARHAAAYRLAAIQSANETVRFIGSVWDQGFWISSMLIAPRTCMATPSAGPIHPSYVPWELALLSSPMTSFSTARLRDRQRGTSTMQRAWRRRSRPTRPTLSVPPPGVRRAADERPSCTTGTMSLGRMKRCAYVSPTQRLGDSDVRRTEVS